MSEEEQSLGSILTCENGLPVIREKGSYLIGAFICTGGVVAFLISIAGLSARLGLIPVAVGSGSTVVLVVFALLGLPIAWLGISSMVG